MDRIFRPLLAFLFFLLLGLQVGTQEAFAFRGATVKTISDRPVLNARTPWSKLSANSEQNVRVLVELLSESKTGKELLNRAKEKIREKGETLADILRAGKGSLTDTTLLRRFSASDPLNVRFETRSKIYINEDLPVIDAVLDMAHELTHFTYRTPFNPYKNDFSLISFIESTVEGEGGEVHAYLTECQVLYELFPEKLRGRYHCAIVRDEVSGTFSREKGIREFYKIGKYYDEFAQSISLQLKERPLPSLSKDEPLFISSAYGKPYPVAAYEEYHSVLAKACENDRKRIGHLENTKSSRSPASLYEDNSTQTYLQNFKDRCQKIGDT